MVSALQRHADGAVGYRRPPGSGRRFGWGPGPRTAPRLPPGYRWIAVRPGPPPPPRRRRRPLGPDPAVSRDTALGPGGPCRLRAALGPGRTQREAPPADRVRTAFFMAAVALGAAAAGAPGAVSVAGHQPQHAAELVGGGRGGAAERVGQPGRDRGGDDLCGGADAMVDRPSRRGVRARGPAGTPVAPGVVGRHAAAAVGGDGAGHHVRRGRRDHRTLGQLGVDGRLRRVLLSAPAGRDLGAGLRHRAGQNRGPLRPVTAR